jgi:cell division protein FtsA
MAKTGLYTGLDIGTTWVKVVVAEYIEDQMNIIGVGKAKSEGLNRGIIIDIEKTVDSIQRAIEQAEERAGIKITNVNVGLPANLLQVEGCSGMIAVNSESKEISDEDVRNVASAALVRSIPPERQIISVIPRNFTVDTFQGIKDPRGMYGVRLEMEGLVYTGPKTLIHNLYTTVEKAGLILDELIIVPLALTETILNDGEKDFGAIVIDLGGGQTTTAIMQDKQMKNADVQPEGGDLVTRDISIVLNTSNSSAERLKKQYGDAYPERASKTEQFPVEVIGKSEPVQVNEFHLAEIIEARMEQIFKNSLEYLQGIDALDLSGGIILTGGGASLQGIVELASDIFDVNVRLHIPNHMGLRNPEFSTVIGLVEYSAGLTDIYHIAKGAVTGDRTIPVRTPYQQPQVATPVQQQQQPQATQVAPVQNNGYADENYYDDNQNYDAYDQEPKEKGPGLVDKAKGLFYSIFD